MASVLFHWGVHGWAIFGVVGLSLAYFHYRYNLPLTIRSGLYPLLKERINGPIGHVVDIFAVTGTMFGIATSLGLGVLQLNSGLNYLFGIPESRLVQVVVIVVVIAAASISVVAGLGKGVRRLSALNLSLAILLAIFVLVLGPTLFLLQSLLQNFSLYIGEMIPRTLQTYSYSPTSWFKDWTLFYWGWWISWSPFVGMFIARISRGRMFREFILGVLLIPTALTGIWMTIFGNSAMWIDRGKADGVLGLAVQDNISVALFKFLDYFPLSLVTSVLAIILVAVFFVTSADSGTLVIDTLLSGGEQETSAFQLVLWAVLVAAIAAILLVAGGLNALQTATVASALPFTFVIIALCFGMAHGMSADLAGRLIVREHHAAPGIAGSTAISWTRRLRRIVRPTRKSEVEAFMANVARPALERLVEEFSAEGVDAKLNDEDERLAVELPTEGRRNFFYGLELTIAPLPGFFLGDLDTKDSAERRVWIARTVFYDGRRGYDVSAYNGDQLIADVLDHYEMFGTISRTPQSELYITSPDPESYVP